MYFFQVATLSPVSPVFFPLVLEESPMINALMFQIMVNYGVPHQKILLTIMVDHIPNYGETVGTAMMVI